MEKIVSYTLVFIPIIYGLIHFLEYSSFLSRVAGIATGKRVVSYTLQQSVFVLTRFGFVAMMPMIGFVVDYQVTNSQYLFMVHLSLLIATLLCCVSYLSRGVIIAYFVNVIERYSVHGSLIKSICERPLIKKGGKYSSSDVYVYLKNSREAKRILVTSSVVFGTYAIGVYASFFAALNLYEYRSSIGQLSGLVNAFATVLLTFYIEPKISISIDKNDGNAENNVLCLLIGRFFGVSIFAQAVVTFMWLI
ncbi:lipid II flippase family protein [Aeromonas veronii]|uniref:lipid II flippase family protein n=1 Tax=Aeromonas veronii TaxID=654 RepID=UPI001F471AE3|nr:DUF2837 family protein [Aeromonas veronii]MCF5901564.1 lipid II flippase Amj family protein [Aeromonas veronii]